MGGKTYNVGKQKARRLIRDGQAARGACSDVPGGCPAGQLACNGGCIPSGNCCTNAGCASGEVCDSGTCIVPTCGTGGACTVFATSATYNGNLGGITGANDKCAAAATAAGLTGTYMAWLSDATVGPASTFTNTANAGPYVLVNDGTDAPQVAASFAALVACPGGTCLEHAIDRDENGLGGISSSAWTGTQADGTPAANTCTGWTTSFGGTSGRRGATLASTSSWTTFASDPCVAINRLYCFEQA